MQIKRYIAATMREAIAQVREEQGPDAVILSNRRTDAGMEVIAAVDYDAALAAHMLSQATPRATKPAEAPPKTTPATQASEIPVAPKGPPPETRRREPDPGVTPADPAFVRMREELHVMRQMLETQLASLAWTDLSRRDPLKAKAVRDLAALDIHPDIAQAIVKEMQDLKTMKDSWKVPLSLLTRRIPVSKLNPLDRGGVVAIVGPTGVGKTTTVAKLAARFALQHGARNVALVSTDTYRIGAREQLHTYARILNVPMHVAQDREDLSHVLDALAGRKLILIDTAGMSQRDMRLNEQFSTLQHCGNRIEMLLALSATSDAHCLDEAVRLFTRSANGSIAGCVLTKLDEAASLGAPLSTVIRHGMPLTYLCTGQRVPEDLHVARGKHAWLVETAVKLRRRSGHVADEQLIAEQYGKAAAHA